MKGISFWILIPAVLLGISVVVGRWMLVNETVIDRRINRGLSWYVAGAAAAAAATVAGRGDLAPQLFLGFAALTAANMFGFAKLLDGGDVDTAARRQRWYDAIAAVVALSVLVAPPLVTVVWLAGDLLGMLSGLLIARACIRELRTAGSTAAEKLTYTGLLLVALYWEFSVIVILVRAASGNAPQDAGTVWVAASLVALAVLVLLISVPLVPAILVHTGWDRTGRAVRQLQPLWQDLTAVVPEVVLTQEQSTGRGSASRLYRMTIEIRDALLHLRRYAPDHPEPTRKSVSDNALRIAQAAHLKAHGGTTTTRDSQVLLPITEDRKSELRNLLALSREWPRARAAAHFTHTN